MSLTPRITFRSMKSQPRLEEAVLKETARLERFFDRMTSCRVMIQGPKRFVRFPGGYHVDLDRHGGAEVALKFLGEQID